jgi:hypothetical protein
MDNHQLPVHRTAAGVSLVVDRPAGLPGIAYWGPALGELTTAELTALITAGVPWLHGSYGNGLDEAAARFHGHLRDRAGHPRTPRPVTMNTWEAVYFGRGCTASSPPTSPAPCTPSSRSPRASSRRRAPYACRVLRPMPGITWPRWHPAT